MPASVHRDRADQFERERAHLLAIAFRILGSDGDAEDVVQEAWLRYSATERADVRNVPAWLTTVVTRLCLDRLRRRREFPTEAVSEPSDGGAVEGPEDVALLASELAEALTFVLERLTPPQRVALVLHDAFGMSFDEIGHVLGTTPGSAKKLASRARGRLHRPTVSAPANRRAAQAVVAEFLRAAREGDVDGLVAVLHPAVIRTADPQILPPGGRQRVEGVDAVVAEVPGFRANALRARLALIDGRPGLVVSPGPQPLAALVFVLAEGKIVHYDVIADPQRLATLHIDG